MAHNSVLVVEDEIIVAESIQRKLNKMGYAIAGICTNDRETLEAIDKKKPNLVLMDIKLEGDIDGISIAEKIRERYDLPIVYLTAYADDKTLQRAKLTTPYGYVLKPFTDRELRSNIEIAFYKHKVEKELKESEKRFRTIIQSMYNGILVTDSNWRITFVNEQFCRLTGYSQEDIIGNHIATLLNKENRETVRNAWENNVIQEARSFELSIKTKLNDSIPLVISPKLHYNDADELQGCIITVTDLTFFEHNQAEINSKISHEVLENIEKNAQPALLIDLSSWHVAEVNEPFLEKFDYSREEVVGRSAIQFANWKNLDQLNSFLSLLNSKSDVKAQRLSLKGKDESVVTVLTDLHLIEKNGSSLSLIIFNNDA